MYVDCSFSFSSKENDIKLGDKVSFHFGLDKYLTGIAVAPYNLQDMQIGFMVDFGTIDAPDVRECRFKRLTRISAHKYIAPKIADYVNMEEVQDLNIPKALYSSFKEFMSYKKTGLDQYTIANMLYTSNLRSINPISGLIIHLVNAYSRYSSVVPVVSKINELTLYWLVKEYKDKL